MGQGFRMTNKANLLFLGMHKILGSELRHKREVDTWNWFFHFEPIHKIHEDESHQGNWVLLILVCLYK